MEPARLQSLELVLLVDLVDRNLMFHLQTMQEKQKFGKFLGLEMLLLLPVFQL